MAGSEENNFEGMQLLAKKFKGSEQDSNLEWATFRQRVPKELQANLHMLLSNYSDGVFVSDIPRLYREKFQEECMFNSYGFHDLMDLLSNIPFFQISQRVRSAESLEFKVTTLKPYEPEEIYEVGRASSKLPFRKFDNTNWSEFDIPVPNDVVQYRDVVPMVLSKLKVGDSLNCELGEIFDLSKFWIYDATALHALTNDLHAFYENCSRSEYNLSPYLIREELYCVVIYFNVSHRCTILNVLDDRPGFVQVFFIDIGAVDFVPITDCYYLHKRFAQLPGQAIRARLADIVPTNDLWCAQAIHKFMTLFAKTNFNVKVVAIDEDLVFDVLVKRCGIGIINHVLVEDGYALPKHKEETKLRQFQDPDCSLKVDNIHLYPTFDELENGDRTVNRELFTNNIVPAHWYMGSYFDIQLPWTDSIFDEVQKNYERNSKKYSFEMYLK